MSLYLQGNERTLPRGASKYRWCLYSVCTSYEYVGPRFTWATSQLGGLFIFCVTGHESPSFPGRAEEKVRRNLVNNAFLLLVSSSSHRRSRRQSKAQSPGIMRRHRQSEDKRLLPVSCFGSSYLFLYAFAISPRPPPPPPQWNGCFVNLVLDTLYPSLIQLMFLSWYNNNAVAYLWCNTKKSTVPFSTGSSDWRETPVPNREFPGQNFQENFVSPAERPLRTTWEVVVGIPSPQIGNSLGHTAIKQSLCFCIVFFLL